MTRFAAPRMALLPAFPDAGAAELSQALAEGGPPLEALILEQALGPLWHASTRAAVFAGSHLNAARLYLKQVAAIREIDAVFSAAAIRYAVIKGTATRERTFVDPALRLCSDIDILVAPEQRVDAARSLVGAGYRLHVDPAVVSHEVVLEKGPVAIDLHWDILRPGRTRVPLTDGFLDRRQRHAGMWMLDDNDALFLMLVHPAFSKHVSTVRMGLHRIADVTLWLQRREVDWPAVHQHLTACGVRTAAWLMLTWVGVLSPPVFRPRIDAAIDALRPGRLRSAYLRSWLDHELSTRMARTHAARLILFSLFLHDRVPDAWHAIKGWRRARASAPHDAEVFRELAQSAPYWRSRA